MTYSKGPEPTKAPETVPVPTLQSGASEAAVQQAIQNAGLRWAKGADVNPTNKKEEPGTFVSSEPASGSKVPAGSVVTYHLAKAAAAESNTQPHGNVAHYAHFTPHPIAPGGPRPREHPARPQRAL